MTAPDPIITVEPGKRGGRPLVRGLRIAVVDVLDMLANGLTPGEVVEEFPDLTIEDVRACLAYAAAQARGVLVAAE